MLPLRRGRVTGERGAALRGERPGVGRPAGRQVGAGPQETLRLLLLQEEPERWAKGC